MKQFCDLNEFYYIFRFFFQYICSRHRCTHGSTTEKTFIDEKSTIETTTTAYRQDFIDNQVKSFDTVRTPMKKPVDHLKPEGDIEFVDKQPFKPAEKVIATRPQDNLFVSGEFNGNFFFPILISI